MERHKRPIMVFLMAGMLFAGTAQAGGDPSTVKGVVGTYVGHNQAQGFTFVPYKKGLDVKLEGPNGFVRDTTSDPQGRFSFSNVPISAVPYVIVVATGCPVPMISQKVLANSTAPPSVNVGLPPCVESKSGVSSPNFQPFRNGPIPTTSASCGSNIQLTSKTVDVDLPTAQRTLLGLTVNPQLGTIDLRFDTTDSRLRSLKPRQVLFLEHLGVRKVSQVSWNGDQIVVSTTPAKLTDFIDHGTLTFPPPQGCGRAKAAKAATQSVLGDPSRVGNTGTISGRGGGDWYWKYSAKATGGETIQYDFTAFKHAAGLDATVSGDGTLESTKSAHGLDYSVTIVHSGVVSQITKYQCVIPLNGKLDISWGVVQHSAGGGGPGDERLRILPFYQEIFDIAKVPFLYQVSANFIFKPGIGQPEAAVKGGFHVQYIGAGNISFPGTSVGAFSADQPVADHVVTSAISPHGVVVAANAPRATFSLRTLGFLYAIKNLVPGSASEDAEAQAGNLELYEYAQDTGNDSKDFFKTDNATYAQWVTEYDFTGTGIGPLNLYPCTLEHFNLSASAGSDAAYLGGSGKVKGTTLYKHYWVRRDPDVPVCGKK
jgi:hypothetical protein